MTLAKATVTGTVYRAPEKRFTQNDIAVYSFTLKLDERDEVLMRIISKRRTLSDVLDSLKMGDRVMVDGRLQTATAKSQDGTEKKFFEIDANDVELISGNVAGSLPSDSSAESIPTAGASEDIVKFEDFAEEELIDEEEIPF